MSAEGLNIDFAKVTLKFTITRSGEKIRKWETENRKIVKEVCRVFGPIFWNKKSKSTMQKKND